MTRLSGFALLRFVNRSLIFVFLVWVWGANNCTLHWGFGFVWFFGLGCFSVVFCVWGDGLVHIVMLDAMLSSVGVVWEYVE